MSQSIKSYSMNEVCFENIIYKDITEYKAFNSIEGKAFNLENSKKSDHDNTNPKIRKVNLVNLVYKDNCELNKLIIKTPKIIINKEAIKKKKKDSNEYYELYLPLDSSKCKNIDEIKLFLEKLDKKVLFDSFMNSSLWFNALQSKSSIQCKSLDSQGEYSQGEYSNATNPLDLSIQQRSDSMRSDSIHYKKLVRKKNKQLYLKIIINSNNNLNQLNRFNEVESIVSNLNGLPRNSLYCNHKNIVFFNKKNSNIENIPKVCLLKMILEFDNIVINNNSNCININVNPLLMSFSSIES